MLPFHDGLSVQIFFLYVNVLDGRVVFLSFAVAQLFFNFFFLYKAKPCFV